MKTQHLKFLLLLSFVVFSSCKSQTDKENQPSSKSISQSATTTIDSSGGPKYNVKVNKQYDSSGHLVRYDSSYSYSYSSPGGQRLKINNDSVFHKFRTIFEDNYPGFLNPWFNNIFMEDSLFKYDFYNKNYFQKRFEMNSQMMEKMFQRMDSIKNHFLQDNYPNGKQKKN